MNRNVRNDAITLRSCRFPFAVMLRACAGMLLFCCITGAAQEIMTVPTYHWSYIYARELSLRHRQLDFSPANWPVTLGDMARLADTTGLATASAPERFWQMRLLQFARTPRAQKAWLQLGGRLSESAGDFGPAWHSRAGLRTQLALFPDRHVALVNAIRLDEELREDPNYLGKRWRGFAGYTEQAYVALHFGRYVAKLGRDFVRWGRGTDATLLLSDYSRPLDHFFGRLTLAPFRFDYLAAKLNSEYLPDSLRTRYATEVSERYLAAARAEVRFKTNLLTLAVTQLVLYGGPGRGFELYYLNPLLAFHGEQLNESLKSNTAGALDAVLRPRDGLECYAQLLIDDVQVEKTRRGDLEPNEIAFLLGGELAEPFGWRGVTLGLEYTRVANRTYNAITVWEKFLHRNRPLAHFLGNDFDRWLVHGRAYAGGNVQLFYSYEARRHGEGRLERPFDMPWVNADLQQGYREKFPSGVVERSTHVHLEARWHATAGFHLALAAGHARYRNFANQAGRQQQETSVRLQLGLEQFWWLGLE
ncbi:MAG: capsule assembly Wzi family protein [candidate division KSB1 bacterium]|nr:capsule assembly Wzi family protein [candidate division KSB1 bacterium]MDZ7275639.1 capsule assembly Wzi family protein [candidate division KSB1 bacterium]MDZ7284670.1 capsule assembly Wzi family protein [candidate division KSB1 bacterium]MDZ7297911.1 capsule assembly Wzi family protein [candidate division KSB1 bacterium]MDZ7305961.1 capsule assembly Wzi family protein [candidate division KSB1 bacterium]